MMPYLRSLVYFSITVRQSEKKKSWVYICNSQLYGCEIQVRGVPAYCPCFEGLCFSFTPLYETRISTLSDHLGAWNLLLCLSRSDPPRLAQGWKKIIERCLLRRVWCRLAVQAEVSSCVWAFFCVCVVWDGAQVGRKWSVSFRTGATTLYSTMFRLIYSFQYF